MENFKNILKSFYVKDELNPKIWENPEDPSNAKMKDDIRERLIEIANEFINFLGLDIFVQDVTMTGSLANYNWSEFSDVDLHVMYDFNESGDKKELVAELFKLKKTLFNSTHDITVKGYDVELYVQDTNEPHVSSGVYSVLYDEWINEPSPEEVTIDESKLTEKVNQWMDIIDLVIEDVQESDEDLESIIGKIDKVKDKLKKYRSCGLEKNGEYSYENLVFKFLRRNGYIQKLFDFENEIIDKRLSLEGEEII
jgi:hypothetical protein